MNLLHPVAVLTLCAASLMMSATPARAASGAAFCAKVQPKIQPLIKLPLQLFQADDAKTNANQTGDSSYVECDFRLGSFRVDVSLEDNSDKRFDGTGRQGHQELSGIADKDWSVDSGGMRWIDVVRGKLACEARLGGRRAWFRETGNRWQPRCARLPSSRICAALSNVWPVSTCTAIQVP